MAPVSIEMWKYRGKERPPFAEEPGPGQESVWDYPRPPRLEPDRRRVIVEADGTTIGDTRAGVRVLETAGPPVFYLPFDDVDRSVLFAAVGGSVCEWKGVATYWSVTLADRTIERAAWSYPEPLPAFESIVDHLSFYPTLVVCSVDGIRVEPQPGGFYGGWVTPEIVGPFKGEPGTGHW